MMIRLSHVRHWWHGRKRAQDQCFIDALLDSLKSQRWAGRTDLAYMAWTEFTHERGQEHWLCDCSAEAYDDVERRLLLLK